MDKDVVKALPYESFSCLTLVIPTSSLVIPAEAGIKFFLTNTVWKTQIYLIPASAGMTW